MTELERIRDEVAENIENGKNTRIEYHLLLEYLTYIIDRDISICDGRYDIFDLIVKPKKYTKPFSIIRFDVLVRKIETEIKCKTVKKPNYIHFLDLMRKDKILQELLTYKQFLFLLDQMNNGDAPPNPRDKVILILAWAGINGEDMGNIMDEDVSFFRRDNELIKVEILFPRKKTITALTSDLKVTITDSNFLSCFEDYKNQKEYYVPSPHSGHISFPLNNNSPYYIKKALVSPKREESPRAKNINVIVSRLMSTRDPKGMDVDWSQHSIKTIQFSGLIYELMSDKLSEYNKAMVLSAGKRTLEYYDYVVNLVKQSGHYDSERRGV